MSMPIRYDLIKVRKWNQPTKTGLKTSGGPETWNFEVGQHYDVRSGASDALGLSESQTSVIFVVR